MYYAVAVLLTSTNAHNYYFYSLRNANRELNLHPVVLRMATFSSASTDNACYNYTSTVKQYSCKTPFSSSQHMALPKLDAYIILRQFYFVDTKYLC